MGEPSPNLVGYFARRFAALLVDYGLYLIFVQTYFSLRARHDTPMGTVLGGGEGLLAFIGGWVFIFPFLEYCFNASPGKQLMALRVRYADGRRRLTFGAAFTRHMLDVVEIVFWLGLTAMFNSKRQRIGDMLADTVVVDFRDF